MSSNGYILIVLFVGIISFLSGQLISNIGKIDDERKPFGWVHVITFWCGVLLVFAFGFSISAECTSLNAEKNQHIIQQGIKATASPSGQAK